MKYNRYLHIFLISLAAIFLLPALTGCRDEMLGDEPEENGAPVDVRVSLSLPVRDKLEVLTRGDNGKLNFQIYDLMVFAFDNDGNLAQRYYFDDLDDGVIDCDTDYSTSPTASVLVNSAADGEGTLLNMRVPSGSGYLMAVANIQVKSSTGLAKLSAVKTRAELLAIQAADSHYDSDVSIMSGAYTEKTDVSVNNFDMEGKVTFRSGSLPGKIKFLSTTAAVQVNIKGKNAATGGTFTLDSYELVSLPSQAPLFAGVSAATPASSPRVNSGQLTSFDDKGSYNYGFEFETLEYQGTGATTIAKYGDRAAWDTSKGLVNGYKTFTKAPQYAPYMIIRGTYSGNSAYVDENGANKTGTVYADVQYFIFLGHNSGTDFRDFNTFRNWQYTYNITINGVNEITVEVNRSSSGYRDDAEGDVIVMDGGKEYRFDSHYAQREFSMTVGEMRRLKKNNLLGFRVIVPAYDVDESMFLKFNSDGSLNNENSNGWGVYDESNGYLLTNSTAYWKKKGAMDMYNLACIAADWVRFYVHQTTASANATTNATYGLPDGYIDAKGNNINGPEKVNYTQKYKYVNGSNNPYLLTMYRFLTQLNSYATSSRADTDVITFTVFVAENYYEDNYNNRRLKTHNGTGAAGTTTIRWTDFVNQPDRKILLFPVTKVSADKQSSYSHPSMILSQRSIRTIYKPEGNYKAWGTESVEEYIQKVEVPSWYKGASGDWYLGRRMIRIAQQNTSGGRSNFSTINQAMSWIESKYARKASVDAMKGKLYTEYLSSSKYFAPGSNYRIPNVILNTSTGNDGTMANMIAACLNRNRDLNGDGKISADEIRWYVPGISQLQALYVGNVGLPVEARLYQNEANSGKWVYKHYLSASRLENPTSGARDATNAVLWAEEGPSTGQMNNSYAYGVHVRCVRDLGTALSANEEPWDGFYTNVSSPSGYAAGYINIDKLDNNCVRTNLENKDLSGVVTTFSNANRPAQSFYYANKIINTAAEKLITVTNPTTGAVSKYTVPDWTNPNLIRIDTENKKSESSPQKRSLCAQNFGQGWRTPTITEIAIMYWAGVFSRDKNLLSRTRYVFWQEKTRGGIDIINQTGNDKSGRDPHSFSEQEFRLRFPWENVVLPTATAGGNVSQISGHYGGILCVKDKF